MVCARKQPAKYRPGGNEYSGDHESGGHGAGVTLIPGYMNNFNTGQVVFRPIAGNAFHCFTDGVEERGDEAGITRFHRHCAGTFGKRNGIITHYFATCVADLSF